MKGWMGIFGVVLGISLPADAGPLTLGKVPWPIIHQNNGGGKNSPYHAPVPGPVRVERVSRLLPGINQLQGRTYYYYQEVGTGKVHAFIPGASAPSASYDLGPSFPWTGGGVIDSENNVWWTTPTHLIRLSEKLDRPKRSVRLPHYVPWNGLNLLPSGDWLVTSMEPYAVVVKGQTSSQSFPIVQSLDLRELTLDGKKVLSGVTEFHPRPVTDGKGSFYFPAGDFLVKWSQDPNTGRMRTELDWVFRSPDPEAGFAVSNAVLIGDQVCINSLPKTDGPSEFPAWSRMSTS